MRPGVAPGLACARVRCRYTKMGYAGNTNPSYIIPTVVGSDDKAAAEPVRGKLDDLDFFVGDEVLCRAAPLRPRCLPTPSCCVWTL